MDIADGHWAVAEGNGRSVLGEGMWAIPGLVDAHAHLAAAEGESWVSAGLEGATIKARQALGAGVMLALDKGWSDLTVIDLLSEVGALERPDIDAAGVVLAVQGGYLSGFAREIDPEAIAESVVVAAKEGNGWVKLIGDWPRKGRGAVANFSEEQLSTAVDVADGLGAKVAIHTMAREVPSWAVRAGVSSIEHGLFLSDEDLAALGRRGGMWVPTVLQMEAVVSQLGADSSGGRLVLEGLENVASLLRLAIDHGVRVLTGTDLAISSRMVAAEAIRLWEMGLSPHDVVAAVSKSGLMANDRVGGFELGSPANAVFYEADPLSDPRILLHPRHVLRLGQVIS